MIIKNINDEIVETYNYKLNDGIPNVNDVKSNLNGLLINKVLVSYDKQRNKFIFKRSLPVSTQIKVGLAENRARLTWRLFYIISSQVLPGNETGARASAGAESQPGQ